MIEQPVIFWQHQLNLPAKTRGFHALDETIDNVLTEKAYIQLGVLHLFLQHTSASLLITENCCADVKQDLSDFFDKLAPDSVNLYRHNTEGSDDMPAHIKNSLLSCQLSVPITNGHLNLGTWQGIYLVEHRNQANARRIILTAQGTNN